MNGQGRVSDMNKNPKWDTLDHRHEAGRSVLKKSFQLGIYTLHTKYTKFSKLTSLTTKKRSRVQIWCISKVTSLAPAYCRTEAYKYSFLSGASRDWNRLPDKIVSSNVRIKTTYHTTNKLMLVRPIDLVALHGQVTVCC